MNEADRKEFATAMTRFFAVYGDELTDSLLWAWWGALEEFPLDEVRTAMTLHAKDPKAGMFRPTPAHLVQHLTVTIPERRRLHKAQQARALADAIDPHDRAIRMACTDAQNGVISPDDAQRIVKREKAEIARLTAAHQQGILGHEPDA